MSFFVRYVYDRSHHALGQVVNVRCARSARSQRTKGQRQMPAAVQQTDMYGTQVRGKLLAVHVAAAALRRGCETGGRA
jgi:hypothetical protein